MKKNKTFIILLLIFILMTVTPDILVPAAISGIRLWGLKVVPALIMGLIFVDCFDYYMPDYSKGGEILMFLCSLLCGFPTGALNCLQYERKHKNNDILSNIMPYCNISSPGFTINYIYYNLIHDYIDIVKFLICIYLPVIILVTYEFTHKYFKDKKNVVYKKNNPKENINNKHLTERIDLKAQNKGMNFGDILNASIEKTIYSILKLGGYIIIFSCVCAYVEHFTYNLPVIGMIVCGILEITNGMYMASYICHKPVFKIITILSINAFGGISTIMQTECIVKDKINYPFDTGKYILQKIKLMMCTLLITLIIINV